MLAFIAHPLAKIGAITLGALILIGVMWWQIDAYGDRREQAGVDRTVAQYKAASDRLRAQARRSATQADDAAADRVARHTQQVATEVEQINEAESQGGSPLDVLFGGGS